MKRRGLAIAVTLLVLAVLMVFLAAVVYLGAHHLSLVHSNQAGLTSAYASEAGIAQCLARLRQDPTYSINLSNYALDGEMSPRVSVEVVNNFQGTAALQATDGTSVPAGLTYLLAIGTCKSNEYPRRTAVMVARGGGTFPYTIAGSGSLTLKNIDISGPIKISGNLNLQSSIDIVSIAGRRGDVLVGGNIDNKSVDMMALDQEVRARGSISDPSNIDWPAASPNPQPTPIAGDTSSMTEPFIVDGRTTNDPPAGREVLPNPDPTTLLAGATNYTGTYPVDISNFALDGKVWVFNSTVNNTVTLDGLTGQGTIVMLGGTHSSTNKKGVTTIQNNLLTLKGSGSVAYNVNLVAIDYPGTVNGNSTIALETSCDINGLVYSHGNILTKSNGKLLGSIISYLGAVGLDAGASLDATLGSLVAPVPGFEAFLGGSGGGTALEVRSWQRL